ncbi:MAG: hypothetical protein QOI69_84 [Pseudonocardiales bacterium]|nr:hypothetical protein [Pseudonocardiales bacterium]
MHDEDPGSCAASPNGPASPSRSARTSSGTPSSPPPSTQATYRSPRPRGNRDRRSVSAVVVEGQGTLTGSGSTRQAYSDRWPSSLRFRRSKWASAGPWINDSWIKLGTDRRLLRWPGIELCTHPGPSTSRLGAASSSRSSARTASCNSISTSVPGSLQAGPDVVPMSGSQARDERQPRLSTKLTTRLRRPPP